MQQTIVWQGLHYDTEEHCSINYLEDAIVVRSEIEGWAEHKAVYVDYVLTLNTDWTMREVEISFTVGTEQHSYHYIRHETGQWTDAEGTWLRRFDQCRFVDISLTPFTNTLALKVIDFKGSTEQTDVLYFDILHNNVRNDVQRYTKLNETTYLFENNGGNFSAEITVDANGFVTHYPNLFEMLKPH